MAIISAVLHSDAKAIPPAPLRIRARPSKSIPPSRAPIVSAATHISNTATVIARADYDKAIALDPVYAGAYFYRSFLSALNGDMNRAVEDLKQTFKLRDRDVDNILRTLSPTERSKALA